MKQLETFAESEFDVLYSKHKRDIAKLKEQRKQHFQRLRLATSVPQTIPWALQKLSTSAALQRPRSTTGIYSLKKTTSSAQTLEPGSRMCCMKNWLMCQLSAG